MVQYSLSDGLMVPRILRRPVWWIWLACIGLLAGMTLAAATHSSVRIVTVDQPCLASQSCYIIDSPNPH